MQFAKDSFFLSLQERLAALNPGRTVTVNGATVPAVVVLENLPPTRGLPQPNTFYIEWGGAEVVEGHSGAAPLMSLDVVISYYSMGSSESMVDRGRQLCQLDTELMSICQPPTTEKRDYTQSPSRDLGTCVFWGQPSLGSQGGEREAVHADARTEGKARLTLYFFPEVILV